MSKIAGSCLCRSIRYRSDAQPMMIAVCHCENCQRQSGTALAIVVGVPAGSMATVFPNLANFAVSDLGFMG